VGLNRTIQIQSARLNPTNGAFAGAQPLRGGIATVNVFVNSSNPAVGEIIVSPVAFNGAAGTATTTFHPLTPGSTTVSLGPPPPGFSLPTNLQSINATVNP
jgi:hypothetical protein